MKQLWKTIKPLRIPLICGLLGILLFRFVLLIGYVPSASMEPAIPKGSYIIGLRIHGEPRRGDIVIFRMGGRLLVKRIAGIPGDIVRIDEYVREVETNEVSGCTRTILTVPDGCYYLLGDNADESRDSRYWEDPFIRQDAILARLLLP